MTTTQIFAELLIIGIGATIWITLSLAAIFGYRFDIMVPKVDTPFLIVLGGVAYVLGIVVDRLARAIFGCFEGAFAKHRLSNPEVIERHIIVFSEALARQIQYNRSRLRICRAWALNLILALPAFVVWNLRVEALRLAPCLVVLGVGFLISVLVAGVAWLLTADHDKNLRDSYELLKKCKEDANKTLQPIADKYGSG